MANENNSWRSEILVMDYFPWEHKYDIEVDAFRKLNSGMAEKTFIWDSRENQWLYKNEQGVEVNIPRYSRDAVASIEILKYLNAVYGDCFVVKLKENRFGILTEDGQETRIFGSYTTAHEAILRFLISIKRWPRQNITGDV